MAELGTWELNRSDGSNAFPGGGLSDECNESLRRGLTFKYGDSKFDWVEIVLRTWSRGK